MLPILINVLNFKMLQHKLLTLITVSEIQSKFLKQKLIIYLIFLL
jgi:hypothetical protein